VTGRPRVLLLLAACTLAGLSACEQSARKPDPQATAAALSVAARQSSNEKTEAAGSTAPFEPIARCRVTHGGMFLDLGTDASHTRRSFALGPFSDVASDTWSDQSYTRFNTPLVYYDFWLDQPVENLEVRIRAKAGSATALAASVDQQRLGSVRVRSESFQTLSFPTLKTPLAAGRHQLSLRWSGRASSDGRTYGMAEWIHWAEPGQPLLSYRPPRQRSLVADVVLGNVPRRSIVLEAPGGLSCPVQIARGSRLQLGLGYSGEGSGVARIVARRDGASPQVLVERRVTGSASAAWTDLSIDLDSLGNQLVQLELEAVSASGSGRLAFSEARITTASSASPATRAKLVVLVVASGLHRELLPPFSGTRRLRHLNQLADESARFPEYRVPTSVVGGVLGTLLSGLPPLAHQLQSPKARLPEGVQTLADRIHETSGESAFFTGVPHTRAVFGFERGWNHYESFSPVSDVSASAPLEHARSWLEAAIQRDPEAARLVVVHVRGGHPPWDLSRDEVAELEPREYSGLLEARRGGLILASIRSHARLAQRRLTPPDWVRLRALQLAALGKQDDALGSLVELLQRANLWDDTLFMFTGDVATGDPPEAPFGAARSITEDRLIVPLWVKFPRASFAGSVVPGLVTASDVHGTIAAALGVRLPEELSGLDLQRLADGEAPAIGRTLFASLGQDYATRWGSWLLRGTNRKTPVLCELSVDPACAHDVIEQSPLAAEALWRATFEEQRRQRSLENAARSLEPALIDKDTAAALQVWGD
jgi:sulfatase-like protein